MSRHAGDSLKSSGDQFIVDPVGPAIGHQGNDLNTVGLVCPIEDDFGHALRGQGGPSSDRTVPGVTLTSALLMLTYPALPANATRILEMMGLFWTWKKNFRSSCISCVAWGTRASETGRGVAVWVGVTILVVVGSGGDVVTSAPQLSAIIGIPMGYRAATIATITRTQPMILVVFPRGCAGARYFCGVIINASSNVSDFGIRGFGLREFG
ncbi:MAG: hypothetical protein WCF90_10795 [Methanomicrobiales archaeon]